MRASVLSRPSPSSPRVVADTTGRSSGRRPRLPRLSLVAGAARGRNARVHRVARAALRVPVLRVPPAEREGGDSKGARRLTLRWYVPSTACHGPTLHASCAGIRPTRSTIGDRTRRDVATRTAGTLSPPRLDRRPGAGRSSAPQAAIPTFHCQRTAVRIWLDVVVAASPNGRSWAFTNVRHDRVAANAWTGPR